MKVLLTLCAFLVAGATFANGKLFKRDMRERSLAEIVHATQNTDQQEFQCMLDNVPECQKKLYVRDLMEELSEIGDFLKKLKGIDWTNDDLNPMDVLEHEEFELLGKVMHLMSVLPMTWNETSQTYTPFGHLIEQCFKELEAVDFSALQSFDEARVKVLQKIIGCEEKGFRMSLGHMQKIDVNSAQSISAGVKIVMEIMAEVRDMNYAALGVTFLDEDQYPDSSTWDQAFEKDAYTPSHIENAIKELYDRFSSGGDSTPDVKVASRSLAKKVVAAHQSAVAAKKDDLRRRIAALLRNLDDK